MKLSDKMLAALATIPHVKKVWVKGDEYHTRPTAGWEEVDVNGANTSAGGEKTYSEMTVPELKAECTERGIATSKADKMADLVKKLEDNDAGLD